MDRPLTSMTSQLAASCASMPRTLLARSGPRPWGGDRSTRPRRDRSGADRRHEIRDGVVPVAEPKAGPNRIHLDLTTTSLEDQRGSVAKLRRARRTAHRHRAAIRGGAMSCSPIPRATSSACSGPGTRSWPAPVAPEPSTCDGTRETGHFWSATLGWPLVWDQDEETAIRAPDLTGPMITWSGPPVTPKLGQEPVAPRRSAVDRPSIRKRRSIVSMALGATRIDVGQDDVDGWSWPTPMTTSSAS